MFVTKVEAIASFKPGDQERGRRGRNQKSKSEMSRFRVLMGSVKMTDSVTTTVAASGSPRARQESRQDAADSPECVQRLGCDGPPGRSRRSFL